MRQNIIVLDFGGQYNQLIARRVRECNVYCEVHPYTMPIEQIKQMAPSGIILTGGPNSVYGEDSPQCDPQIFKLGIPILGICYGAQLLAHQLGGKVATAPVSEYGRTEVIIDDRGGLLAGLGVGGPETTGCAKSDHTIMWMSHTDYAGLPGGCYGERGSRLLRDAVPPGGHALHRRLQAAAKFRTAHLRL